MFLLALLIIFSAFRHLSGVSSLFQKFTDSAYFEVCHSKQFYNTRDDLLQRSPLVL